MTYSESDFSFAINSVSLSDFDYVSESDFSSAFMNLHICIFILYSHFPKPADGFFYPFS